jgi:starch synthase
LKVLLAHPGTQYSSRLAEQLSRLRILGTFHTGIAVPQDGALRSLVNLIPRSAQRKLSNRRLDRVPGHEVRLHVADEAAALLALRLGGAAQRVFHRRNARFQRHIPKSDLLACDAVIGFDTSAWILASRCERAGIPFVLDQSIGHPASMMRQYDRLRALYPDWADDMQVRLPQVREAEEAEHGLAKRIVAASSFTCRTLLENGVPRERIRINPYGVDCWKFRPFSCTTPRPFRFVFVGSVSARKGIAQLIGVWRRLAPRRAELWIVGPADEGARRRISGVERIFYKGAVPHAEIPALLSQCDVFIFPSFFEGFALVILEAMASGLPVITTTATAGPDLMQHGLNGWILEPGDDDALMQALETCLAKPWELPAMGREARRAAERHTWDAYGSRWLAILDELIAERGAQARCS